MVSGVYGIFARADGSCLYVGQSKDVYARWRQHETRLKCKRTGYLQSFIEWFHSEGRGDIASLEFRLLDEGTTQFEKNVLELYYFTELSPRFFGKVPSLNETYEHSLETRKAISEAIKKTLVDVTCAHCGNTFASLRNNQQTFCKKDRRLYEWSTEQRSFVKKVFPRIHTVEKSTLEKLYLTDGLNMRQIGELYGVTQPAVYGHFQKLGIESRSRGNRTGLPSREKALPATPCEACKQSFIPIRSGRRFCSPLCKAAAQADLLSERSVVTSNQEKLFHLLPSGAARLCRLTRKGCSLGAGVEHYESAKLAREMRLA